MKNKKTISGIFILLLLATGSYCQEPKQQTESHSPQPLLLTIKSNKSAYTIGEEITLVVQIKNTGDKAINIMHMDFSAWGQSSGLIFNMQDSHNRQPNYVHIEQLADMGYSPNILILQPNETFESPIELTKWYKFVRHGQYRIKAEFERNMNETIAKYKDYGKCYRTSLKPLLEIIPTEEIKCSELSTCWAGVLVSNTITITIAPDPVPTISMRYYPASLFTFGEKKPLTLQDVQLIIKDLPAGSIIKWHYESDVRPSPLSGLDIEAFRKFCEDNSVVLEMIHEGG